MQSSCLVKWAYSNQPRTYKHTIENRQQNDDDDDDNDLMKMINYTSFAILI